MEEEEGKDRTANGGETGGGGQVIWVMKCVGLNALYMKERAQQGASCNLD